MLEVRCPHESDFGGVAVDAMGFPAVPGLEQGVGILYCLLDLPPVDELGVSVPCNASSVLLGFRFWGIR